MRKHAVKVKKILAILALGLIVLCATAKPTLSQQINDSTRTDEQRRAALVTALERAQSEVVAGRKFIDSLKEQVKSKEKLIDKLNDRDRAREQIEASLQTEITQLRAAIAEQKTALQIKTDEVDYLKKQLAKAEKKLKASHTREKVLVGVATILTLILILK